MITTKVTGQDRATPVVLAIAESVKPERLKPIVGRAGVRVFKRHFLALDASNANRLGGERSHFYRTAAEGSRFAVTADGVELAAGAGLPRGALRQRILGGTIRPGAGKKFLTLPARAEAYGHRASEFNDLVLVRRGGGGEPFALARAFQTRLKITGAATAHALGVSRFARGEETGGEILFWLKKEVVQKADPAIAPSLLDLAAGIKSEVGAFRDAQVERARQAQAEAARPVINMDKEASP